jgi:hypothetical protein
MEQSPAKLLFFLFIIMTPAQGMNFSDTYKKYICTFAFANTCALASTLLISPLIIYNECLNTIEITSNADTPNDGTFTCIWHIKKINNILYYSNLNSTHNAPCFN